MERGAGVGLSIGSDVDPLPSNDAARSQVNTNSFEQSSVDLHPMATPSYKPFRRSNLLSKIVSLKNRIHAQAFSFANAFSVAKKEAGDVDFDFEKENRAVRRQAGLDQRGIRLIQAARTKSSDVDGCKHDGEPVPTEKFLGIADNCVGPEPGIYDYESSHCVDDIFRLGADGKACQCVNFPSGEQLDSVDPGEEYYYPTKCFQKTEKEYCQQFANNHFSDWTNDLSSSVDATVARKTLRDWQPHEAKTILYDAHKDLGEECICLEEDGCICSLEECQSYDQGATETKVQRSETRSRVDKDTPRKSNTPEQCASHPNECSRTPMEGKNTDLYVPSLISDQMIYMKVAGRKNNKLSERVIYNQKLSPEYCETEADHKKCGPLETAVAAGGEFSSHDTKSLVDPPSSNANRKSGCKKSTITHTEVLPDIFYLEDYSTGKNEPSAKEITGRNSQLLNSFAAADNNFSKTIRDQADAFEASYHEAQFPVKYNTKVSEDRFSFHNEMKPRSAHETLTKTEVLAFKTDTDQYLMDTNCNKYSSDNSGASCNFSTSADSFNGSTELHNIFVVRNKAGRRTNGVGEKAVSYGTKPSTSRTRLTEEMSTNRVLVSRIPKPLPKSSQEKSSTEEKEVWVTPKQGVWEQKEMPGETNYSRSEQKEASKNAPNNRTEQKEVLEKAKNNIGESNKEQKDTSKEIQNNRMEHDDASEEAIKNMREHDDASQEAINTRMEHNHASEEAINTRMEHNDASEEAINTRMEHNDASEEALKSSRKHYDASEAIKNRREHDKASEAIKNNREQEASEEAKMNRREHDEASEEAIMNRREPDEAFDEANKSSREAKEASKEIKNRRQEIEAPEETKKNRNEEKDSPESAQKRRREQKEASKEVRNVCQIESTKSTSRISSNTQSTETESKKSYTTSHFSDNLNHEPTLKDTQTALDDEKANDFSDSAATCNTYKDGKVVTTIPPPSPRSRKTFRKTPKLQLPEWNCSTAIEKPTKKYNRPSPLLYKRCRSAQSFVKVSEKSSQQKNSSNVTAESVDGLHSSLSERSHTASSLNERSHTASLSERSHIASSLSERSHTASSLSERSHTASSLSERSHTASSLSESSNCPSKSRVQKTDKLGLSHAKQPFLPAGNSMNCRRKAIPVSNTARCHPDLRVPGRRVDLPVVYPGLSRQTASSNLIKLADAQDAEKIGVTNDAKEDGNGLGGSCIYPRAFLIGLNANSSNSVAVWDATIPIFTDYTPCGSNRRMLLWKKSVKSGPKCQINAGTKITRHARTPARSNLGQVLGVAVKEHASPTSKLPVPCWKYKTRKLGSVTSAGLKTMPISREIQPTASSAVLDSAHKFQPGSVRRAVKVPVFDFMMTLEELSRYQTHAHIRNQERNQKKTEKFGGPTTQSKKAAQETVVLKCDFASLFKEMALLDCFPDAKMKND